MQKYFFFIPFSVDVEERVIACWTSHVPFLIFYQLPCVRQIDWLYLLELTWLEKKKIFHLHWGMHNQKRLYTILFLEIVILYHIHVKQLYDSRPNLTNDL